MRDRTDPAGRLLQGLRHDRLARRLAARRATSSRASSRSTSTRSCRPRRRPRTRPLVALTGAEQDVQRMVGEYDRRRRHVRGRPQPHRPADRRAARRVLRLPAITAERPRPATQFSERLLFEQQVAVIPGGAFGPSGEGHVRAMLATSYEQLERRSCASTGSWAACAGDRAVRGRHRHRDAMSSCGRRPRCSAAARTDFPTPPPTPHLPGLPGHARACCRSSTGGRSSTCWRPGIAIGGDDARGHALGPQELLLPGPAQGLPDQPVRPAAGVGAAA